MFFLFSCLSISQFHLRNTSEWSLLLLAQAQINFCVLLQHRHQCSGNCEFHEKIDMFFVGTFSLHWYFIHDIRALLLHLYRKTCYSFPVIAVKTCGSNLQGPSGTFTSPNFPIQYESNSQCVWIISASDPNKVVLISGEKHINNNGLTGMKHIQSQNSFMFFLAGSIKLALYILVLV